MKKALLIPLVLIFIESQAQQTLLKGKVLDNQGNTLGFASLGLLNPNDSTLAFFGISNGEGLFEIKNIDAGNYLLQLAYMGYKTLYRNVQLPLKEGNDIGILIMQPSVTNLNIVEVTAENIPILFKKDTIEYNAGSFKTKPDAVAEDLLKKLPGIEVDRAGNIKAQGEYVKKVLVDGKEFFGNDPKVATKNLPADAIKTVQSFYKKSEQAELTGIDDGLRENTINLILKDDKKNAYFGDIKGGVGTDEHYQASAKLYRFKKQSQFAALGMLNNINQFGFTLQDYINYSGGIQNLVNGEIAAGMPLNFGEPVPGFITSAAVGCNYTYEQKKNNRFNISYMANGADKNLDENTYSRSFTNNSSFIRNDILHENTKTMGHRVYLNWRNRLDSTKNIIITGDAGVSSSKTNNNAYTENFSQSILMNDLISKTNKQSNSISANVKTLYLKTFSNKWKFFKLSGDASHKQNLSQAQWENLSHYFSTGDILKTQPFQNNNTSLLKYSAGTSITRSLGRNYYLEPEMNLGVLNETLGRKQGMHPGENNILIDSLSPSFMRQYQWLGPALNLSKSSKNIQFTFSARLEAGLMNSALQNQVKQFRPLLYFTPKISLKNGYKSGRNIDFYYDSNINTPNIEQLLPVVDNTNPLQLYTGNSNLLPEYSHNGQVNWQVFDQFSLTSFMMGLGAGYTRDKINWSRTINNNLGQTLTLVNVPDDYRLHMNTNFSTPIRKLGISMEVKIREGWSQGINLVNGVENTNTNNNHDFTISFNNRQKEKWDVNVGSSARISNAQYSIEQSLNNRYNTLSCFTEISYSPNNHWRFFISADITQYSGRSFNQSVNIPLIQAEIARYFLKGNRGVLILECFDLLNKNTDLKRISDSNYLMEKRSNIIGRYLMITFKYRLNKFEGKEKIDIQIEK